MRIAVVGAGLAGLSAAWLLARPGLHGVHEVELYERQHAPGFTASSVGVPAAGGSPAARVDVPLRVFYPGYYPTLSRLYEELGVRSEPVSYDSSFIDAAGGLTFRYRNLLLGARSFSYLAPADFLAPQARPIVSDVLRFNRRAAADLRAGRLQGRTIGEYVGREGYSAAFVEGFLLPAVCTVCTCPTAMARELPGSVVVDYLVRGLTRQAVRRALHGADDVQARLLQGIATLHAGRGIESVRRDPASGTVSVRTADGLQAPFDHVVFATAASHALRLLADASPAEAAMLAGFRYAPVEVLTHRDASFMPARRAHWSSVTLRVDPAQEAPESTIWINAVQPALRGAADVFQTVGPHRAPRPGTVLGQARFERPVVSAGSQAALQALTALHAEPARRVWFCGSYAQAGVPLLESAVRSAADVAQALGAAWPPHRADSARH